MKYCCKLIRGYNCVLILVDDEYNYIFNNNSNSDANNLREELCKKHAFIKEDNAQIIFMNRDTKARPYNGHPLCCGFLEERKTTYLDLEWFDLPNL